MQKSQASKNISRRNFLTVAGSVAGVAAFAVMGLPLETQANTLELDLGELKYAENQADVLVVGSGMAGLFAAVKAHDAGARVLMVSKGRLGASGQTPFARGIFSFDPGTSEISLDDFVTEVSRSAMGTNNPVFTRQLAEHSADRVRDLKAWGFFDSNLYATSFMKPIAERKIPIMERIMLTHLIKEDGRIAGAAGFSLDEARIHFFRAKSVILCTGAGGFKPNGFPICDLTHDGSAMAYAIGAKVTGKEWNDGHHSNLKNPAAVYDQWQHAFETLPETTGVSVVHHLGVEMNYETYMNAPRTSETDRSSFVAESLAGAPPRPTGFEDQGPSSKGGPGGNGLNKIIPPTDAHRPPPGMGGIPSGGASAGMSIHKAEGITPINEYGASTIPGLYAAGDALGSHMSGGIYTQIGSSLAGSAVQGGVVAEAAAAYAKSLEPTVITDKTRKRIEDEILAPLRRERGYSPAWVTQTLQGVMIPNFVLYIKKERMLTGALAYIEELRDHHLPMLKAADLHELRLAHETANMILNAEMKLRASLMRRESRCSHYRLDYPEMDTENWNAWINIFKGDDGTMHLEKQPFGRWPA